MMRRNGGAAEAISRETSETSRKAVIRYTVGLFAAVIFFTVLSYLMQNRDVIRMNRRENASAIQNVETLREEYNELQEKYNELLTQYNELLDEIETEVVEND